MGRSRSVAKVAPSRAESVSLVEARRIALAAQGFDGRARDASASPRALTATLDRLRLLQIDSVNVLVRAHYLPLFSRRGPYPTTFLDRLAYQERRWFEYWGHAASLLPVRLHPLLRWRMERGGHWPSTAAVLRASPGLPEEVLRRVASEGPLAASDLAAAGPRPRGMWNWGPAKHVAEWLFATGRLAVAGRRGFERLYDLPERVLPADVLSAPAPSRPDAQAGLLLESAQALGIGTLVDLADYFRLRVPEARPIVARLAEEGRLRRVSVEGWRREAYLPAESRVPRRSVEASALISPFDSLVFHRERTERLFGFRYRIGIYTPAAQCEHGYYVLPFLTGERLRARIDLKADRPQGRLLVRAAHLEPGERAGPVSEALAGELRLLASWLGLPRILVERRGDLSPSLRVAVGPRHLARGRQRVATSTSRRPGSKDAPARSDATSKRSKPARRRRSTSSAQA